MRIKRRQKAFTLIELLIVIVIIGILAGLIIWAVRAAVVKARDAQAKNSVKVVQDALEVYMTENTNLRTSDFGKEFPDTNKWYELNETRLSKLTAGGQSLITTVPKDGVNGPLKVRICGSVCYGIESKSASDSKKCWMTSAGTKYWQNNLDSSPSGCN